MLATVYSFLGDDEKVMELLDKSFETKEAWLCCLPVEARFERYFHHERFQRILREIGHPMAGSDQRNIVGTQVTRDFGDLSTILVDEPI
jgi:hypothetical protein